MLDEEVAPNSFLISIDQMWEERKDLFPGHSGVGASLLALWEKGRDHFFLEGTS